MHDQLIVLKYHQHFEVELQKGLANVCVLGFVGGWMLSWWVDVWMEAKESLYNAVRNWFKYKWLCPHQVTRITECIFCGGSTDSCWIEG